MSGDKNKNAFRSEEPAFVAFVQKDLTMSEPDPRMLAVKKHKIPDAYMEFEIVFSDKLA